MNHSCFIKISKIHSGHFFSFQNTYFSHILLFHGPEVLQIEQLIISYNYFQAMVQEKYTVFLCSHSIQMPDQQ